MKTAVWVLGTQFGKQISGRKTAGWTILHYIVIAGLILFGALYIYVVNHTATQGYRMRALEERILTLKKENKAVELELASQKSVQAVRARVADRGFVPVGSIKYVSASAPSVAFGHSGPVE